MAIEANRVILEAARDEWNRGNLEGYLQLYDSEAVLHGYAGVGPGIANIRSFYEAFWNAFRPSTLIFEDVFGEGAHVACRFVVEATHNGAFQGVAPTGKQIVLPGITILRFANERCVERWSQADFLGLLIQLEVVTPPA